MRELKVHLLMISEGGGIARTCGIRVPNIGTTWIPRIATCKTCKHVRKRRKWKI